MYGHSMGISIESGVVISNIIRSVSVK